MPQQNMMADSDVSFMQVPNAQPRGGPMLQNSRNLSPKSQ